MATGQISKLWTIAERKIFEAKDFKFLSVNINQYFPATRNMK